MQITVTLYGDWQKALDVLGKGQKRIGPALDKAVMEEAKTIQRSMVGRIDSGAFKPHAEATPYIRRGQGGSGDKVLKASGLMRKQILVTRITGGQVFVGILNSAPGRRAWIAGIQQRGVQIPITPKMRRYLHLMLHRGGAPTTPNSKAAKVVITIPPRPFIDPIVAYYARNQDALKQRIMKRVLADLFR